MSDDHYHDDLRDLAQVLRFGHQSLDKLPLRTEIGFELRDLIAATASRRPLADAPPTVAENEHLKKLVETLPELQRALCVAVEALARSAGR